MTNDIDALRQTGRTSVQMRAAPKGALYVYPQTSICYARALAEHLGRTDLVIIGQFSAADYVIGRRFSGVVIDHACWLFANDKRADELRFILSRSL